MARIINYLRQRGRLIMRKRSKSFIRSNYEVNRVSLIEDRSCVIGAEERLKPTVLGIPNEPTVVREQPKSVTPGISNDEPAFGERQRSATLGLLEEIENNLEIANNPRTSELLPFQTKVWDENPDVVRVFQANVQKDLLQAYIDMVLANSIVWLATELGRRSTDLDSSYIELCAKIGARLGSVMSFPNRPNSSSMKTS